MRTFVADLELDDPCAISPERLHGYDAALLLCRLNSLPIGQVRVPVIDGEISWSDLLRQLLDVHGWRLMALLAKRAIASGSPPDSLDRVDSLLDYTAPASGSTRVTVAVCTRNRTEDLRRCLRSLRGIEYPYLDLVVVDNAPADSATARLVSSEFPTVRYVVEPDAGLDRARNRAIQECRGEILAFADDDVVVDPEWVSSIVRVFECDSNVGAVTGLVLPLELETEAQHLFEVYGGFGRGFERRWYRADPRHLVSPDYGGTGRLGTGANMAFRRSLFDRIGRFDPALDVGTCTNGGGDLDMFFRVLKSGSTFVYEPAALVRHRHRRQMTALRTQIANNGVGFYSFLTRTADAYPDESRSIVHLGIWWFWWWNVRRTARRLVGREPVPLSLLWAELVGSIQGTRRYHRARRVIGLKADATASGPQVAVQPKLTTRRIDPDATTPFVVDVDLSEPLRPIDTASGYQRLRIRVSWSGEVLGYASMVHGGATVSPAWLLDAITSQLSREILDARARLGVHESNVALFNAMWRLLSHRMSRVDPSLQEPDALPLATTVSVVLATRNRPDDLERCLRSLCAQTTSRPVEIIVVDNAPDSGLSGPVAARFPVRLIDEPRAGLSFARNAGIRAASGDIVVCTDDDVVAPQGWMEQLVAPFVDERVMVVTGNVIPLTTGSEAERIFELYGGLGRGLTPRRADGQWFRRWRRAVPTWELGCTANAAFRRSIFERDDIGMMDEALGAGTPTGCSEDTYVFYRVLKAGYDIVYQPKAWVWHAHRNTIRALRQQIYSYAKGHAAYQLTTWLRDGDARGLVRLALELPRVYLRRALERLRGQSDYPLSFVALEVFGTLAGPFALWRSRRRARRLRSHPTTPVRRDNTTSAGQEAA